MQLTSKELTLIQDTDFLLTKMEVLRKMILLLEETRDRIMEALQKSDFKFPAELNVESGKISRGENYRSLPYQVLDFPAIYHHENILAFRTMFWWGHHFSVTLHLQGKYLDRYLPSILKRRDQLLDQGIYLSVGKTPWQYHFGEDNYIPFSQASTTILENHHFLKLGRKIELNEWAKLPVIASGYFEILLQVLAD